MERALAEMEKIRRAEEIYSRRKNNEDNDKKTSKSVYKKMFEILFLINVIIIIVAVQNQNYIFTKDFIKQVNSYNFNIKKKFEEWLTVTQENEKIEIDKEEKKKEEVVSGESNDVTSALVENEDVQEELSEEEKDIKEIKNTYSLILPVTGVKTSGFGERTSSNSKVTKYHTGIDIGAEQGVKIKSAMDGKVIQVSSCGDYGKHIRVQNGDLVVLYAHCSKMYVSEGQEIKQGEEIGEVGATGNATGPHLHFEIKLNDRLVDPEKIFGTL